MALRTVVHSTRTIRLVADDNGALTVGFLSTRLKLATWDNCSLNGSRASLEGSALWMVGIVVANTPVAGAS